MSSFPPEDRDDLPGNSGAPLTPGGRSYADLSDQEREQIRQWYSAKGFATPWEKLTRAMQQFRITEYFNTQSKSTPPPSSADLVTNMGEETEDKTRDLLQGRAPQYTNFLNDDDEDLEFPEPSESDQQSTDLSDDDLLTLDESSEGDLEPSDSQSEKPSLYDDDDSFIPPVASQSLSGALPVQESARALVPAAKKKRMSWFTATGEWISSVTKKTAGAAAYPVTASWNWVRGPHTVMVATGGLISSVTKKTAGAAAYPVTASWNLVGASVAKMRGPARSLKNWILNPRPRESWDRAKAMWNWIRGPHPLLQSAGSKMAGGAALSGGLIAKGKGPMRNVGGSVGHFMDPDGFDDRTGWSKWGGAARRRAGSGGVIGSASYVMGNFGIMQNALLAGSIVPAAGLSVLSPAIPWLMRWRRRRRQNQIMGEIDPEFKKFIDDCKNNHTLNVSSFEPLFKNEQSLATNVLVNTIEEQALVQGLHAALWPRSAGVPLAGTPSRPQDFPNLPQWPGSAGVPILGSVDLYAKYVLPVLVSLCRASAIGGKEIERIIPDELVRQRLADCNPNGNAANPGEPQKWERLRQASIAYAKLLAKREEVGKEGQITGATFGPAVGAGLALGFTTPPGLLTLGVAGATWLGRKIQLKIKHADVGMEIRPDGKLDVNLDPQFFDAGGISLYTGGMYIRNLQSEPDNKTEWLKNPEVKEFYDRILQVPLDVPLGKSGALRSPESLAVMATNEVQSALERSIKAKGLKKKGKPDEIEKQKKKVEEIKQTKEKLETKRDTLDSEINGLEAQKASLERQKIKANTRKSKCDAAVTTVKMPLDKWRKEKIDAEMDLAGIESFLKNGDPVAQEEIQDLRTAVGALQDMIADQEAKTRQFQQEIDAASDSAVKQQKEGECHAAQAKVDALKDEQLKRENELKACETSLRKKSELAPKRKEELLTKISGLEMRIMPQDTEFRRLQQIADEAQDKVEDVDAQIATLDANLQQKQTDKNKIELKITGRYEEAQVTDAQEKLDKLELGEETHPSYNDIGKSEAASKAFAIRIVEVYGQRKKPSLAWKATKAVFAPVTSFAGEATTELVVKPAVITAGSASVVGGALFVGGKVTAAAVGGSLGTAVGVLSSPVIAGFVGAGVGALLGALAFKQGVQKLGLKKLMEKVEKKEEKKEPEKK